MRQLVEKMWRETERLMVSDKSEFLCREELDAFDECTLDPLSLILHFEDFNVVITNEAMEAGAFRADGTFDCSAIVVYNGSVIDAAIKEWAIEGYDSYPKQGLEELTERPVSLSIEFFRLQQFKPNELYN